MAVVLDATTIVVGGNRVSNGKTGNGDVRNARREQNDLSGGPTAINCAKTRTRPVMVRSLLVMVGRADKRVMVCGVERAKLMTAALGAMLASMICRTKTARASIKGVDNKKHLRTGSKDDQVEEAESDINDGSFQYRSGGNKRRRKKGKAHHHMAGSFDQIERQTDWSYVGQIKSLHLIMFFIQSSAM